MFFLSKKLSELGLLYKIDVVNVVVFFSLLIFYVEASNPDEKGSHFEGDIRISDRAHSGVVNIDKRWPQNTVVYQFDPTFRSDYRENFSKAMNHIAARTCIKFKERKDERDYIYVGRRNGCWSYVGREGGEQFLSLGDGCGKIGIQIHELIHAIGFFHEQSRTDRDKFVTVNLENVIFDARKNFQKYGEKKISSMNLPYDYSSIMHYSRDAFSANDQDTITPLSADVEIGQREAMSALDIERVNKMYCPNQLEKRIRLKNVFDGTYLSGNRSTTQEMSIIRSIINEGELQIWIVDADFEDMIKGSDMAPWSQEYGFSKVMREDIGASIAVLLEASESLEQKWWFRKMARNSWQIVNVYSGKCVRAVVGQWKVKMAECNPYCAKQLWKIENIN